MSRKRSFAGLIPVSPWILLSLALALPWLLPGLGICGPLAPSPEVLVFVNGREYHTITLPVEVEVERGHAVEIAVVVYYQGKQVNAREFTYEWCFDPDIPDNPYCGVDNHTSDPSFDYKPDTLDRQELRIIIHHNLMETLAIPISFTLSAPGSTDATPEPTSTEPPATDTPMPTGTPEPTPTEPPVTDTPTPTDISEPTPTELLVIHTPTTTAPPLPTATPEDIVLVDDFLCGQGVNRLGGMKGATFSPPNRLVESYIPEEGPDCIARLEFEVVQDGWSGFYERLQGIDISEFYSITLLVKSDSIEPARYSFHLELKRNNNQEWGRCHISEEIDSSWQKVGCLKEEIVPVQGTMSEWDNMSELVIVFDQYSVSQEIPDLTQGVLYVDDIQFEYE
jgi:hypothetical protein